MRSQAIDIHAYVALVNCQRRVLQVLGIVRDPKVIDGAANGRERGKDKGSDWQERNVASDPRRSHEWPVTHKGAVFGSVKLAKNKFVLQPMERLSAVSIR
jgi:hypothetical protein